jgi:hypothetical protein
VNVPFIYRHDTVSVLGSVSTSQSEETINKAGLGDVSAGFSYQPLSETGSRPGLIVNLAYKADTGKSPYKIDTMKQVPTGTGYKSIKGGVNLIKSIDPVVVFGGLSYAYNFAIGGVNQTVTASDGSTGTLNSVSPGDTITMSLGLAYALSYKFSMNFQFEQDYTLDTKANGKKVANTNLNAGLLRIGAGWSLTPTMSLNVSIANGLTSDAPDFILEVRLPMVFF